MNKIEKKIDISPFGEPAELALFTIEEMGIRVFGNIIKNIGTVHSFGAYIKPLQNSELEIGGKRVYLEENKWNRVETTFVPQNANLLIYFNTIGKYFFFHSQIEIGNKCTDFVQSEEDTKVQNIYVEGTEEIDGGKVHENTVGGDALVAHTITARELTVDNIVGENGWINLADGTFNYGGGKFKWDGESLEMEGVARSLSHSEYSENGNEYYWDTYCENSSGMYKWYTDSNDPDIKERFRYECCISMDMQSDGFVFSFGTEEGGYLDIQSLGIYPDSIYAFVPVDCSVRALDGRARKPVGTSVHSGKRIASISIDPDTKKLVIYAEWDGPGNGFSDRFVATEIK